MIQSIIAGIIVTIAVLYLFRKKKGCKDKSCDGCPLKSECRKKL